MSVSIVSFTGNPKMFDKFRRNDIEVFGHFVCIECDR